MSQRKLLTLRYLLEHDAKLMPNICPAKFLGNNVRHPVGDLRIFNRWAKMTTIQERLKAFIKSLNISERDFCKSIGVSHSYVSNVKNKVNASTREALAGAYPLLNIDWLLTGRGNMLLDEPRVAPVPAEGEKQKKAPADPAPVAPADDMASRLLALVESQQQTIAQLTENNSRLTRLVEAYKKAPAVAPGIPAPAVVD